MAAREVTVRLRTPHERQEEFVDSTVKRIVIRAGRRSGKTTGVAIRSVKRFLAGRRQLYATPTSDQLESFWFEVKRALAEPIDLGILRKNEVDHVIEFPGTKQRIRAKTAWNADTLRGDYADDLMLDEFQLMNEDTWDLVGAPMLLDNDGDAVFIYTPPSLRSRSVSKANDPKHASKMFRRAEVDPRWQAIHFTSHENPHISAKALEALTEDMTILAIRQEIGAEDIDEVPGALWSRRLLDDTRVPAPPVSKAKVAIGVDPPGGRTECGIVGGCLDVYGDIYVLADASTGGSPNTWASRAVDLYVELGADVLLGETNFGGDMVEATIKAAAAAKGVRIHYEDAHASRGKAVRAEPQVAKFERGKAHIVGSLPMLEDELTGWVPGVGPSPNRLDAMVWMMSGLRPIASLKDFEREGALDDPEDSRIPRQYARGPLTEVY